MATNGDPTPRTNTNSEANSGSANTSGTNRSFFNDIKVKGGPTRKPSNSATPPPIVEEVVEEVINVPPPAAFLRPKPASEGLFSPKPPMRRPKPPTEGLFSPKPPIRKIVVPPPAPPFSPKPTKKSVKPVKSTKPVKSVPTRKVLRYSPNSTSLSSSAERERAYTRIARAAGLKKLTRDHQSIIHDVVNSASNSPNSSNERSLIKRIKHLERDKKLGATRRKQSMIIQKDRNKEKVMRLINEKKRVEEEYRVLARQYPLKVPKKGLLHLAQLRSHGYELSVKHHVHLGRHIADKAAKDILKSLKRQTKAKKACDICALDTYLESL